MWLSDAEANQKAIGKSRCCADLAPRNGTLPGANRDKRAALTIVRRLNRRLGHAGALNSPTSARCETDRLIRSGVSAVPEQSERKAEGRGCPLNRRIAERETGKLSGGRADCNTVCDLLGDLLSNYRSKNAAWLKNAAGSTIANRFIPFFEEIRANDFSTAMIDRYKDERLEAGAANATVNRELAMLRRAFNLGVRATPPTAFLSLNPSGGNVRIGFFEHEEFLRLRQHLPPEIQPVITFAYCTGCRKGEGL